MSNCQRDSCAGCLNIEECLEDAFLLDLQIGQAAEDDLRLILSFAEGEEYEVYEVPGVDRTFALT